MEGFLLAPGTVDLSELLFTAVTRGNTRALADGGDFAVEGSSLGIAVFLMPEDCVDSDNTGCDLPELGIGANTADGSLLYCCDEDSMDEGVCTGSQFGRLIMNTEIFAGSHRLINVPDHGEWTHQMTKYGHFEETVSGKYGVVFANCNESGRMVIVEGRTIWKSKHGYLPGDLFGLMYFYASFFLLYFALLLWYGIRMKMFEDASIPIQTWIFGTICMGTLELFFRTGDLFVWNEDGSRFSVAFYIGEYGNEILDTNGVFFCHEVLTSMLFFLCSERRYCRSAKERYIEVLACHGITGLGCRSRRAWSNYEEDPHTGWPLYCYFFGCRDHGANNVH